MPSVEDKEKVLSDYYKFWMNLKYNLGFSSAKNWKKPPSPYSSCKDGYSDNETLHDSGKCRKERFVNITRKQDQGWSTSDWFQFVLFCSLPIVTTLVMYALFGNNLMQYGLALRNYRKLMFHRSKELNKLEVDFGDNQKGLKEAIIKLDAKILERAKAIGISKFDDESGSLPYWYSPRMNECEHPVDNCNNVQTWTECHKYKNKIEWEATLWTNLSGLGPESAPETRLEKMKDIADRNEQHSECDFTLPQSTWWINQMTEKVMKKSEAINEYMNSPEFKPTEGYPGIANFPIGGPKSPGIKVGMFEYFGWWFMQRIWGPLARLRRSVLAFFCTLLISAPDPMDPDYNEKINKPSILEGLKFMFIPTMIGPIMSMYLAMETAVSPIYILSQLFSRTFYAWPFTPMVPFNRTMQRMINLFSYKWTASGIAYLFTSKSLIQMMCWIFWLSVLFGFTFVGYSITLIWDIVSFMFFLLFGPWAAPPVPPEGPWQANKRPGITGWSDFSMNRRFLFLHKYRVFIILMFIWGIIYGPGKMYLDNKSVQAGLVVFLIFAWQMLSRMFSLKKDKDKEEGEDDKKGDKKKDKEKGGIFSKMTGLFSTGTKKSAKGGESEAPAPKQTADTSAATTGEK